jgi:hypothetical protein
VTGTVDVGIVTGIGRIFDVGGGDGDTALPLLRSLINGAILKKVGQTFVGLAFGDRRS